MRVDRQPMRPGPLSMPQSRKMIGSQTLSTVRRVEESPSLSPRWTGPFRKVGKRLKHTDVGRETLMVYATKDSASLTVLSRLKRSLQHRDQDDQGRSCQVFLRPSSILVSEMRYPHQDRQEELSCQAQKLRGLTCQLSSKSKPPAGTDDSTNKFSKKSESQLLLELIIL